jgi:isoamylase
MEDIVTYAEKHNEANKENGNDGHSENYSANWGVEGATDDTAVNDLRLKVKRAMLATLFFSQGTPMLLGGDEFGRTQLGNNNAYCQDNELSWLDWTLADNPQGQALSGYVRQLARIRRQYETLQGNEFSDGGKEVAEGIHQADWFDERGNALTPEDWQNPEARALVLRRARKTPDTAGASADSAVALEVTLLLINGDMNPLKFTLPQPALAWHCLIDSARAESPCAAIEGSELMVEGKSVMVISNKTLYGRADD